VIRTLEGHDTEPVVCDEYADRSRSDLVRTPSGPAASLSVPIRDPFGANASAWGRGTYREQLALPLSHRATTNRAVLAPQWWMPVRSRPRPRPGTILVNSRPTELMVARIEDPVERPEDLAPCRPVGPLPAMGGRSYFLSRWVLWGLRQMLGGSWRRESINAQPPPEASASPSRSAWPDRIRSPRTGSGRSATSSSCAS
jgi:hypothetical protein